MAAPADATHEDIIDREPEMFAARWAIVWTVVLSAAAGCSSNPDTASHPGDAGTPSSSAASPVVVDTDLASDDLIALAFLLSSPRADVRAVTVSGTGEVRCPQGLRVIRGLLAVTGDEDIPVACGRSTTLGGVHAFPSEWRDAADDAWGLNLPTAVAPPSERNAVDLLNEALRQDGVTLLTLGPLTNVADTFRRHPEVALGISRIVVMGGAVDVPGNVFGTGTDSPNAEWNLYIDPTAAAEVLHSGAPILLIGLDATNQLPITAGFVQALQHHARSKIAAIAADLLRSNPLVSAGNAYFWDPLAAAAVLKPEVITRKPARITVITGNGRDSGRSLRSRNGSPVTVAMNPDAESFEQLLKGTLQNAPDVERQPSQQASSQA